MTKGDWSLAILNIVICLEKYMCNFPETLGVQTEQYRTNHYNSTGHFRKDFLPKSHRLPSTNFKK